MLFSLADERPVFYQMFPRDFIDPHIVERLNSYSADHSDELEKYADVVTIRQLMDKNGVHHLDLKLDFFGNGAKLLVEEARDLRGRHSNYVERGSKEYFWGALKWDDGKGYFAGSQGVALVDRCQKRWNAMQAKLLRCNWKEEIEHDMDAMTSPVSELPLDGVELYLCRDTLTSGLFVNEKPGLLKSLGGDLGSYIAMAYCCMRDVAEMAWDLQIAYQD